MQKLKNGTKRFLQLILKTKLPARILDINLKAFQAGYEVEL